MDIDQLKQILALVREHDLAELEIEQDGLKVKIRKDAVGVMAPPSAMPMVMTAPAAIGATAPAVAPPAASVAAEETETGEELAVVKSPIVGTFYRSSEPNAPPFIEIGSVVKKGQVLCIIEAMKLMNEIDSEYDGEVVNVYVDNGQPVQYGERLFAIRTK